MAILGLQGVRGGTGTTSITAALARALQLLGETVLVVDASPDNMLRFFSTSISATKRAGRAPPSTAPTGATPGCATLRISICCLLVS